MKIIMVEPNPSGGYPPIQVCDYMPKGYVSVECDTDIFYQYNGFVKLNIVDDKVISMEGNIVAWNEWKASLPTEPPVEQQIETLKRQLTETDYKIIKCSEYQLAGKSPLPYDIAVLHTERQMLRDKINALEAKIQK